MCDGAALTGWQVTDDQVVTKSDELAADDDKCDEWFGYISFYSL